MCVRKATSIFIKGFSNQQVVAIFEDQHGGPADGTGIRFSVNADAWYKNIDGDRTDRDLQYGGDQSNRHMVHAAEKALHGVRETGIDDGEGFYGEIGNTGGHHYAATLCRSKELHQRLAEEKD